MKCILLVFCFTKLTRITAHKRITASAVRIRKSRANGQAWQTRNTERGNTDERGGVDGFVCCDQG